MKKTEQRAVSYHRTKGRKCFKKEEIINLCWEVKEDENKEVTTGFNNMEVTGDLDKSSHYGVEGIEAKFELVGGKSGGSNSL